VKIGRKYFQTSRRAKAKPLTLQDILPIEKKTNSLKQPEFNLRKSYFTNVLHEIHLLGNATGVETTTLTTHISDHLVR